jgi:hypothetical protein
MLTQSFRCEDAYRRDNYFWELTGAGPGGIGLMVSQVSDARPALRRETWGTRRLGLIWGREGAASLTKNDKNAKNRNGFWDDLLMTKELRSLLALLVGKITALVISATVEPAE